MTEGRRLKSLKMLFTRNSIIDATAEEEEGRWRCCLATEQRAPKSRFWVIWRAAKIRKSHRSDWSISMQEEAASVQIQETVGLDGTGNEMMTKLSPVNVEAPPRRLHRHFR